VGKVHEQLEKKTYVHQYGMMEVDYASQVEIRWSGHEKVMVQATPSVDMFSQGKVESICFNKEIGVKYLKSIREHGWKCNLVMYVFGQMDPSNS
jgi:hypothetical protein